MTDLHEQAHLYVVGALLEGETVEFEAHLATCADCAREVAELREVTAQLSETTAIDPPATLRESVLAAVAATSQADRDDRASHERDGGDSTVVPIHRGSRAHRFTQILAAAAVVAALALGGWAIQSRQDAQDATAQTEQLTQLLGADDVQAVPGRFTSGGTGSVIMSASKEQAMFVGSDLPDPPDGRVYEAWTIDGTPAPAGTFSPDGSKSIVELPEATLTAKSVAVTLEPEGGSDQPTSDAVFTVTMPQ